MSVSVSPVLLVLTAGILSCGGNLLLKWSRVAAAPNAGAIEKLLSIGFMGGMLLYAANVVLFAKALDSMAVSSAYPILAGTGFALLAIASWGFFGESMSSSKLAGLLLVTGGIVLLARGG